MRSAEECRDQAIHTLVLPRRPKPDEGDKASYESLADHRAFLAAQVEWLGSQPGTPTARLDAPGRLHMTIPYGRVAYPKRGILARMPVWHMLFFVAIVFIAVLVVT
jgi:hypothetical protein